MNKPATRWQIFSSMVYDGLLLLACYFLVILITQVILQQATLSHYVSSTVVFLCTGAYFIGQWYKGSQTLPMQTWKIRLRTFEDTKPTFKQLVLRFLFSWPLPILTCWLIYRLVMIEKLPSPYYLFMLLTPFTNIAYSYFNRNRLMIQDQASGTRIMQMNP